MQFSFNAVLVMLVMTCLQSSIMAQALTPQQQNGAQPNQQQTGQAGQTIQRENGTHQTIDRRITHDPEQARAALNQIANNATPQTPQGFPLDAESQAWVDQLLRHWESESERVRSYRCDFQRWHYMPGVLNWRDADNKLAARMVSRGKIRFSKPDLGRYDVDEVWHFQAPQQAGGEPTYELNEDVEARKLEQERWICDGKAIYEFDFANKRLNEMKLPPEMQGEGLSKSPLPFVFGAKADDLKSRYWIRPMMPDGIPEGHYMIEAIPKNASDAQVYSKVQIVLRQQPFLPIRVELFAANYDKKRNPESLLLVFENLKLNDPRDLIQKAISDLFGRPVTPYGWERFDGDVNSEPSFGSAGNNSPTANNNRNIK